MYLYDRNGDKIEIYSMEPKRTEITEYKRKETEKTLLDHRLLEIETNSKIYHLLKSLLYKEKLNQLI